MESNEQVAPGRNPSRASVKKRPGRGRRGIFVVSRPHRAARVCLIISNFPKGACLTKHSQRPAPAPQALPGPLRGRVHQVAAPLPGLVRVGGAGQALRLEAGPDPLGAGLRRALRAHQGRPALHAAAPLGVLGTARCYVNGGLTQRCYLTKPQLAKKLFH